MKPIDASPLHAPADSPEACEEAFRANPIDVYIDGYRTHGEVFRIWFQGKAVPVLAGMEANQFIWTNSPLWSYYKAKVAFREQMGDNHVTGLDPPEHSHKRKMLKPAFSMEGALRFLDTFSRVTGETLEAQAGGETVELQNLWAEMIARYNCQSTIQADIPEDEWPKLIDWEHNFIGGVLLGDRRHEHYARPGYQENRATTRARLAQIVTDHLDNPDGYDDNLAQVITNRREAEGEPDFEKLVNDAYFLLLAGIHNTSGLINWCLVDIFRHPDWADELRAEVDTWDPSNAAGVANLPKLKATILEAQRLRPLVYNQSLIPHEAFEFGGYTMPADTRFLHPIVLGHFLEEYYPEPFSYLPQRFLSEQKFAPKTHGFFGGGQRICIGRNHSLVQTPVVLAHILKRYTLTFERDLDFGLEATYSGQRLPVELPARIGKFPAA